MTETVLIENRGPVRLLTLNRPDKLNAINGALSVDLKAALAGRTRTMASPPLC